MSSWLALNPSASHAEYLSCQPVLFLIAFTYAVTIAYASTLRFVERLRWWVDIQLAIDAVLVSASIYFTGGSPGRARLMKVEPLD